MLGPVSVIRGNAPMPDLLGSDGFIHLMPASYYDNMERDGLRLWALKHARYGFPTIELVDWLKERIGTRSAIEIGSGCGDLAHYLQIPATDNFCQNWPGVRELYALAKQPIVQYGPNVLDIDAQQAVMQFKPDVVVASWVTQWIDPNEPPPRGGGSVFGVKEDEILDFGATYIFIGNCSVHGDKKIMKIPHREYNLPFIRSRSARPELNRVWVWNE